MAKQTILPPCSRFLLGALVIVLLAAALPARSIQAQETPTYTYRECEAVEESALRDELNAITQQIFAEGRDALDLPALVARQWLALDIDATIDREVERAVDRVYENEDYWDRFLSGWSAEQAEEFTRQIANDAFSSEAFAEKIDALSTAVANAIAAEMTVISARSASSALLCVQAFIGDSYSDTMATLFEEQIQEQVAGIDLAEDVEADVFPLLESRTRTIAGLGVIIGSQIAQRLARKLAQRIAGKVVGRILGRAATTIIPIAGWIIGGGLIVWDLIEGGQGALPQIQQALQDETVKAGIQQEVVAAVDEELRTELPNVARTVSNDIYSQWLDFRRKYARVLNLADQNERFREIVDEASADQVEKIADLVVISEQTLGQEGLTSTIDRGLMDELLLLPGSSYQILRSAENPEVLLAWADLAGADLERVVATELYRVASPHDFIDRADLEAVLALEDPDAIAEVMLLNRLERDVLLGLPDASVVNLSEVYEISDLRWLASYIAQMEPRASHLLVERLLRDPTLMDKLQSEAVREAVVGSENVEETLAFLSSDKEVQRSPVESAGKVLEDAERVLDGEVTWLLWWRKYGTLRNILVTVALLLALAFAVRIFWRRQQPVNVTVNVPDRHRD